MPKALVAYVRYMDAFTMRLGSGLHWGVFAIIGILMAEAVLRYVFNQPTPWSIELAAFVFGSYFFLAGGYTLFREGHVRMDVLYNRWSPKRRAITNALTFGGMAFYLGVFLFGGFPNAIFSYVKHQHTATQWGPPLAPIKFIILVGVIFLLLQGISIFIRDISTIKGKPIQ